MRCPIFPENTKALLFQDHSGRYFNEAGNPISISDPLDPHTSAASFEHAQLGQGFDSVFWKRGRLAEQAHCRALQLGCHPRRELLRPAEPGRVCHASAPAGLRYVSAPFPPSTLGTQFVPTHSNQICPTQYKPDVFNPLPHNEL